MTHPFSHLPCTPTVHLPQCIGAAPLRQRHDRGSRRRAAAQGRLPVAPRLPIGACALGTGTPAVGARGAGAAAPRLSACIASLPPPPWPLLPGFPRPAWLAAQALQPDHHRHRERVLGARCGTSHRQAPGGAGTSAVVCGFRVPAPQRGRPACPTPVAYSAAPSYTRQAQTADPCGGPWAAHCIGPCPVTPRACPLPGEGSRPMHEVLCDLDRFRVDYFRQYIGNATAAVEEDGVMLEVRRRGQPARCVVAGRCWPESGRSAELRARRDVAGGMSHPSANSAHWVDPAFLRSAGRLTPLNLPPGLPTHRATLHGACWTISSEGGEGGRYRRLLLLVPAACGLPGAPGAASASSAAAAGAGRHRPLNFISSHRRWEDGYSKRFGVTYVDVKGTSGAASTQLLVLCLLQKLQTASCCRQCRRRRRCCSCCHGHVAPVTAANCNFLLQATSDAITKPLACGSPAILAPQTSRRRRQHCQQAAVATELTLPLVCLPKAPGHAAPGVCSTDSGAPSPDSSTAAVPS